MAHRSFRKSRQPGRVDELPTNSWRPLVLNEVRRLLAFKLEPGCVTVERYLLALLIGERQRLIAAAEAARWLIEVLDAEGLVELEPVHQDMGEDAPVLERAAWAVRGLLAQADGISGGQDEDAIC